MRNYIQRKKVMNYQSRQIEEICNLRADTILLPSSASHFCWKLSHGAQPAAGAEGRHSGEMLERCREHLFKCCPFLHRCRERIRLHKRVAGP